MLLTWNSTWRGLMIAFSRYTPSLPKAAPASCFAACGAQGNQAREEQEQVQEMPVSSSLPDICIYEPHRCQGQSAIANTLYAQGTPCGIGLAQQEHSLYARGVPCGTDLVQLDKVFGVVHQTHAAPATSSRGLGEQRKKQAKGKATKPRGRFISLRHPICSAG